MCVNGVPIGRSISNSGAYVMDPNLRLVPVGVARDKLIEAGTDNGHDNDDYYDEHYFRYVVHLNPPRYYRVNLGPFGRHVFDVLLISKGKEV